jgi:lipopolysaccharide export system permease protein
MKTFTSVFVILFFIFILQSIWLFIAELAGKDLDFITILKFILYFCPTMVPLVLPLSILLASIMTFGSMAENYEFAAMKSGGVSLLRTMKVLIVSVFVLGIIGFLFANNIIPESQYRFVNLRKSILQTKPAMAIGEGQFNNIGTNTTIKVEKKSGENGEFLQGVTMHTKTSEFSPVNTVIVAKKGVLKSGENTNILQLELLDGYYYEDVIPSKYEERQKMPFAKSTFKKYNINIDLAKIAGSTDSESEVINQYNMLNMSELNYTIDSLNTIYKKDVKLYSKNIHSRSLLASEYVEGNSLEQKKQSISYKKDLVTLLNKNTKNNVLDIAITNMNNIVSSVESYDNDLKTRRNYINDFKIAFYDKTMVPYACILMFFIGAPLGAIIRKGGLGLPIVFAVLIFITFNFANTFGRKLASQDGIHPFLGVAIGALLLTPFAVLFTKRALADRGISIDLDWLLDPIKRLLKRNKIIEEETT